MQRRTLLTAALCTAFGAAIGGTVVYAVMGNDYNKRSLTASREYKASMAQEAARTLARLRTGDVEEATFLLEDNLDMFLSGVPMAQPYPQLTERCQRAMAHAKVYRSRFPFPGACKVHSDDLHFKHVPDFLENVPLLPPDHEWLDSYMRKVGNMPPAPAMPHSRE